MTSSRPTSSTDRTVAATLESAITETAPAPVAATLTGLPPRYEQRREVGRGSMGTVVLAWDAVLRREVAIKLLRSGAPRERFLHEARVTGRLEHPAIVPVHDAGETADGAAYYAMRLVRGRSLQVALDGCRTVGERLAWIDALIEVARGLAYAHARGVVHRDLKPENVMLGPYGEVLIVDWGLALVLDERDPLVGDLASDAERGRLLGTPLYMSPEQARGEPADARSDVWALGMMLRLMLTGRSPWRADTALGLVAEVRAGPPPPVARHAANAPPELAAIAERATRHAPDDRYPHAGAIAEELQRWRAGRRVAAHHYSLREELARFLREYRRTVQVAALVLALLVAGLALVGRESGRARRAEQATAEANTRLEANLVDAWVDRALRLSDEENGREALAYAAAALAHREADPAMRGVAARWLRSLPAVLEAAVAEVPDVGCQVLLVRGTGAWCLGSGGAWHVAEGELRWYRPDLTRHTRLDLDGDRLGVGGPEWGVVLSAADGKDLAPPLAGARGVLFPPGDPGHVVVIGQRSLTRRTWPDLAEVAAAPTSSIVSGYRASGEELVVATASGWVHRLDLATLAERSVAHTEPRLAMYNAAFSPDGLRAVSSESSRGVAVWSWQDLLARRLEVSDSVDRVGWSDDGRFVWWADRRARGFHLADARTLEPRGLVGVSALPGAIGFDAGGSMVLVTGGRVERFRVGGPGRSLALDGGIGWVRALGPDRVAVGVGDGTVRIVDPTTLEVVERRATGHPSVGAGMLVAADGAWLVARNEALVSIAPDGVVTELLRGRAAVFPGDRPGEGAWVSGDAAAFPSAAGERRRTVPAPLDVATATYADGELRYEAADGWWAVGPSESRRLVAPTGAARVAPSPDGATLAWSVDHDLVFSRPDGSETARCPLPGRVGHLAWVGPDRVAVASDFDVRILRDDCGVALEQLRLPTRCGPLARVGDWLVVGHWDGELDRAWLPAIDLPAEELAARVAERTGWPPVE